MPHVMPTETCMHVSMAEFAQHESLLYHADILSPLKSKVASKEIGAMQSGIPICPNETNSFHENIL
jgi:hypothetical protein